MSHAALPVLYTIPLSHYCERARWALDWAAVPYREERHLQMFHRRPVRRAGGGHTVPVLRTASGTLADSAAIVAWADEHAPADRKLYPADHDAREHVLALERTFSEELGVETRRLAYFSFLPYGSLLLRYNNQGAPGTRRYSCDLASRWPSGSSSATFASQRRPRPRPSPQSLAFSTKSRRTSPMAARI